MKDWQERKLLIVDLNALGESSGRRKTAPRGWGSVFELVALQLHLQLWYMVKGIMGCIATVGSAQPVATAWGLAVCSGPSSSGTVAAALGDQRGARRPFSCLSNPRALPKAPATLPSAHIFDDRAKTVELRVTRLKWSHWTFTLCP